MFKKRRDCPYEIPGRKKRSKCSNNLESTVLETRNAEHDFAVTCKDNDNRARVGVGGGGVPLWENFMRSTTIS